MKGSRILLLMIFGLLLAAVGCREEKKVDVAASLNPNKMATMTTKNVSTLISDSGVIQYKVVSPLWKVYDQIDTQYWIFPEG
ncbi:MAG: LPS export ABC transporter periplasmic protein LptC, partial [Muribaculaceae bacterium]|nr:LPS export ABC transporter periplasmic protein LptC [Muribaculaceae bacterium]